MGEIPKKYRSIRLQAAPSTREGLLHYLMILARAPLRICLGGGGTDLPFYYLDHEGYLLTAGIDKYIYVTLAPSLSDQTILRAEDIQQVDSIEELSNELVRETLNYFKITQPLNITVTSSIPSGTGMGSSSTMTVALIKAILELTDQSHKFGPHDIAEMAYHIERVILNQDGGKQDQFISAYGKIQEIVLQKDGAVVVKELNIDNQTLKNLEDNLALFYIGMVRSSSQMQAKVSKEAKLEQLHLIKDLGKRLKNSLTKGNIDEVGKNWHEHWTAKKQLAQGISNGVIDDYYDLALKSGAFGGKLIGAGGGGFLIFYSPKKDELIEIMRSKGLKYLKFAFSNSGAEIFYKE